MAQQKAVVNLEAPQLTDEDVAYNNEVNAHKRAWLTIHSDVTDDMRNRQIPEGLKVDKVYGKEAANRTVLNTFGSIIKKGAETIVPKLLKGAGKKAKGKLVGFATPSYIDPQMAKALGLKEGESVLWERGGQPIFSPGGMTKFFSHLVMVEGLVHVDDLSKFRCNDMMRNLYGPWFNRSTKDGTIINPDALTFTSIQQLNRNFVVKKDKANPGPHLATDKGTDAEKEKAKKILETLASLDQRFVQLGTEKENVEHSIKLEAKCKQSVITAKEYLDAGQITELLFNKYVIAFTTAKADRERLMERYKALARSMGI